MSLFSNIEQDLAAIHNWFVSTPIGKAIEDDAAIALKELESLAAGQLTNIAKEIGLAVMTGYAAGGTSGAITAGIAQAEASFKAAGKTVTSQTMLTLTTTIANQVATQTAPVAPTPPTPPTAAPAAG